MTIVGIASNTLRYPAYYFEFKLIDGTMKRMSSNSRLVIVSNRLPVTARVVENGIQLTPSTGGLATGLQPYHDGAGGLWVGWPGMCRK